MLPTHTLLLLQTNHYHVPSLGVVHTTLYRSLLPIHPDDGSHGIDQNNHLHLDLQGLLLISIGPDDPIDRINRSRSSLRHQFDPIVLDLGGSFLVNVRVDGSLDHRDVGGVSVNLGNPSGGTPDTVHR